MANNFFTIKSCKFDGSVHKSWPAECLEETQDYWLFVGKFSEEVNHPKLGVIQSETISYEFYWKKMWYNVFRFHEPDGSLRNFYCNINQPPKLSDRVLSYIDLDIDVLVWNDFKVEILDVAEFEVNSMLYNYSDEIKTTVQNSLQELLKKIEIKEFPFNFIEVKG